MDSASSDTRDGSSRAILMIGMSRYMPVNVEASGRWEDGGDKIAGVARGQGAYGR